MKAHAFNTCPASAADTKVVHMGQDNEPQLSMLPGQDYQLVHSQLSL